MARQVEHALSPPALTERQRQVADGVARGLTNDEIAAELGIAPRTVKAHCDTLRIKLGVSRRRQIAPAFLALQGHRLPRR
jgi:DNA-binding CsgD family transcriptional regulator